MFETRQGELPGKRILSRGCQASLSEPSRFSELSCQQLLGGHGVALCSRGRCFPAVPQSYDAPVPPAARREPPGGRWDARLGHRQRHAQRDRPGLGTRFTMTLASVPVFRKLTTVVVLISYSICFNGRTGVAEEDSREKHPAACTCSTVPSLMKESMCQHPLVKTALILRVQYFLRAVAYRQIFKRSFLYAMWSALPPTNILV